MECALFGVALEVAVKCRAVPVGVLSILVLFAAACSSPSSSSRAGPPDELVDQPKTSTVPITQQQQEQQQSSACPSDMVLVAGGYCPDVRQTCTRYVDPPGSVYSQFRCAEYGKPQCLSPKRDDKRFCIDRYEYTAPGEKLPLVHQSWTTATAVCKSQGKRLCMESEWQFACEGEAMHAYPYGDGFHRDASACNIDRTNLGRPNSGLRDLREPAGAHDKCVSPFGVHDMSGNVEEWSTLDHPGDPKEVSSMKGAWWLPGRNHCRAATTGHGQVYEGAQVGVRCCADASS